MQLLWVAEPSSAVLPFGHGLHASEVSEKFSLKVFLGHFVHVAPVPVLRCSHTAGKAQRRAASSQLNCGKHIFGSLSTSQACRCKAVLVRTSRARLPGTRRQPHSLRWLMIHMSAQKHSLSG